MDKFLIAIFVFALLVIIDKHDHNQKMEELFPGDDKMQDQVKCHMYLEVLFLIGSAICIIAQLFGLLVTK